MKRLILPIFVKLFSIAIIFSFISCASDVFDLNSEAGENISTAVSVSQVKATGNENLSRAETKAPEMYSFKVEGAKGEMYMRYTAAAGIAGKGFTESLSADSRGKMITTADFHDDYGLYIYEYSSANSWANNSVSSAAIPVAVNERVLKAKNWKTNDFWPGAGSRLALYAYAPYNATGITNLPAAEATGKPRFHYVVPSDAVEQNDLLVSEDDEYSPTNVNGGVDVPGNYNATKTLKFKHACTAVRIAVGDQMAPCTITKIVIKGVYGAADFNYGAGSGLNEGAWETLSTPSNYTLTADFTVSATDKNKVINDGRNTFMLLPQTVPDDAVIEITLNDGEEHVIKAKIGGSNWKMGYSVTYFLNTSTVDDDYVLMLSSSNTQMSSTGGSNSFSIISYRQTFYGSQVAVPWTLAYNYSDDVLGTSPWSGSIDEVVTNVGSFKGNGSITGESNSIQVVKQVERSKPWRSTHTAVLRAAAQQGTESSPVDLSEGKQTANCYVVSAPGYYKFPLVYGNARNADGSDNAISYSSATFVDHKDVRITSPYIYLTNGGANVPADAFLVWQDAPHLVNPSSVKLSSDKHYIEFQVRREDICQGNSVLAVCDANGTIMWSWHIWVTDYSMTNTIEVHNNPDVGGSVISHFMEVPLGYCEGETRVRDKRTFDVKVRQTETGGKTSIITFNQLSADSLYTYGNNATYYQWGRKDPMLPSNGMGDIDKPFYDKQRDWKIVYGYVSIGKAIQAPFTLHYIYNDDWSVSHNMDNWNINCMGSVSVDNIDVTKTIYDPSVSGFTLPKTAVFTGFTTTGTSTSNISQINVSDSFNKGWNFYTAVNGGTIFFEALGFRDTYDSGGAIIYFGTGSDVWTSGAVSTSTGRCMYFHSRLVDPQHPTFRSLSFLVRPVAE